MNCVKQDPARPAKCDDQMRTLFETSNKRWEELEAAITPTVWQRVQLEAMHVACPATLDASDMIGCTTAITCRSEVAVHRIAKALFADMNAR
jgi:hypothetical protein